MTQLLIKYLQAPAAFTVQSPACNVKLAVIAYIVCD